MTSMRLLLAILVIAVSSSAQSLKGIWDATVKVGSQDIPFKIEFGGTESVPTATFFNG